MIVCQLYVCQTDAVNNFPPLPSCCPIKPCFYQDFVLEIPAEFQRIVKTVFYTWIGMMLFYSCSLAYKIEAHIVTENQHQYMTVSGEVFDVLFSAYALLCGVKRCVDAETVLS